MTVSVKHTYTHDWACDACGARVKLAYEHAATSEPELQRRIPDGWTIRTSKTNRGVEQKHLCAKCTY
jgi:hypothetical protein